MKAASICMLSPPLAWNSKAFIITCYTYAILNVASYIYKVYAALWSAPGFFVDRVIKYENDEIMSCCLAREWIYLDQQFQELIYPNFLKLDI